MQRESRALGMEPRNFFRLGKRRLDGVPELLEHRVILVIGPPWSSLVLSHLGPRSGPSWSCLVLVGLAPRSLALAGPWFVFLGFLGPRFSWSSVLGPSRSFLDPWSLVLGPCCWSLVFGPRSSVLGPWSLLVLLVLLVLGPCPSLVLGLSWSSVLLGLWSLVLGSRWSLESPTPHTSGADESRCVVGDEETAGQPSGTVPPLPSRAVSARLAIGTPTPFMGVESRAHRSVLRDHR